MKPTQRLFVTTPLGAAATVSLNAAQSHYLAHVLRLGIGDEISVFDGQNGQWQARIKALGKKGGEAVCETQTQAQAQDPDLWLLFAPVKGDRGDMIIEKACELGVAGLVPVITERTIVRKVNLERLQARAIEAAEQCGRLTIPQIHDATPLSAFYQSPTDDGIILFADEAGDAVQVATALADKPSKVALLTGPEGGFTPQERAKLRACAHIKPISLGPRILRAETATFAGLSLIQSVWGDWR